MTQFRITQKFAADSKIQPLAAPHTTVLLLDDWVIDALRIHRKKVALVTHVRSLPSFLMPYAQVGGAKSVPDCVPICLRQFLYDHDFSEYVQEVERIFSEPAIFCKVDHRPLDGFQEKYRSASVR